MLDSLKLGKQSELKRMLNPYRRLLEILPQRPLLVGTVLSISNQLAIIELPGGAQVTARGASSVGQRVFLRDDVVEGNAPNLTLVLIEI